jgi:hypothetical protein
MEVSVSEPDSSCFDCSVGGFFRRVRMKSHATLLWSSLFTSRTHNIHDIQVPIECSLVTCGHDNVQPVISYALKPWIS